MRVDTVEVGKVRPYCSLYAVGESLDFILGVKERFVQGNGMTCFMF